MILHYLKIVFRDILKNKFRYLLTTLGIAVGMVIFSIIFFFADGSIGTWNKKTTNENLFMFVTSYFAESGKPQAVLPFLRAKELQGRKWGKGLGG